MFIKGPSYQGTKVDGKRKMKEIPDADGLEVCYSQERTIEFNRLANIGGLWGFRREHTSVKPPTRTALALRRLLQVGTGATSSPCERARGHALSKVPWIDLNQLERSILGSHTPTVVSRHPKEYVRTG